MVVPFHARVVGYREQTEILSQLSEVPGSIILIHSSLLNFGIPEGGLHNLWRELYGALGKHRTIIMPTFTFTNGGSRIWDWHKSKSEVGALSEYFRSEVANYRTIHPLHSLALHGPDAKDLSNFISSSSFGVGSIWDLLTKHAVVTNLSLGVGMEGGATFLHHSEEIAQVPYRNYVAINREVIDEKGNRVKKDFKYFARRIENGVHATNNWTDLKRDLSEEKHLKTWQLNARLDATIMDIPTVTNFVRRKLTLNKFYVGGY